MLHHWTTPFPMSNISLTPSRFQLSENHNQPYVDWGCFRRDCPLALPLLSHHPPPFPRAHLDKTDSPGAAQCLPPEGKPAVVKDPGPGLPRPGVGEAGQAGRGRCQPPARQHHPLGWRGLRVLPLLRLRLCWRYNSAPTHWWDLLNQSRDTINTIWIYALQ